MRDRKTHRLRQTLMTAAALLIFVAIGQIWIMTAGLKTWPREGNYISRQADAFIRGQLSLTILPPRDLLALPNPYDPVANFKMRLHDALLYHRKYYLYWGPAPALLLAAVCEVARWPHADFADEYVGFAGLLGSTVLAAILVFQIRARWFANLSESAIALPILSLGLGTPMLFTLARPAIYEAMIGAGQFFLLAGFCAILRGAGDERPRRRWFVAAGCFWALSIGSRVSLFPGIAAAAAVVLWHLRRTNRRSWLAAAACLGGPIVLTTVLLGGYNFARFGSFTEFGLRWQLASEDKHDAPMSAFFSSGYVPVNAFRYLLTAPEISREFPFIVASEAKPWLAGKVELGFNRRYEFLVGLLWTQPFLLFLFAAGRRGGGRWMAASLGAAAFFGFVPDLGFEWSTMRYLLDTVPCCTLLATFGYFNCLDSSRRRRFEWPAVIVVVWQIALALILGMTGYYENFKSNNEPLYHAMKSLFGK